MTFIVDVIFWFVLFVIGYLLIYYTADFLIDILKDFSRQWNVSPIVSGILILGIDFEESIVSLLSAVGHLPYLSLGNLIGNTVIAIAISFGLPALFLVFQPERTPRVYLFVLAVLGLSVFLSTIFPRYLSWFGVLNLLFFVVYVGYTINLQRIHLKSIQGVESSTTTPRSAINPSTSQNVGASHTGDLGELERDEKEKDILLPIKIFFLIIVIFVAGELMVISAEHLITSLALKETFFGLVIMAFVTNVEEFWLIVKAIRKQQVTLGVSAEIGKILWNLSFIYGLSSLFLREFAYKTVMMQGSFVMWLALMLLVISLLVRRMTRLQSFSFLSLLLVFLSFNISSLIL